MGIWNVPMYQLCDTDEAKFCIVDIERNHGRGYKAVRVRHAGHYTRGAGEISLIMTVEPGNPQIPPDIMLLDLFETQESGGQSLIPLLIKLFSAITSTGCAVILKPILFLWIWIQEAYRSTQYSSTPG